jgi:hypothetical protein
MAARWGPPPNRGSRPPGGAAPSKVRSIGCVQTPRGIVIPHWRCVRDQSGNVWLGVSSRPLIGTDGQLLANDTGKRVYHPTVGFRDKATEIRFVALARQVLRRDYREIFAGGGVP